MTATPDTCHCETGPEGRGVTPAPESTFELIIPPAPPIGTPAREVEDNPPAYFLRAASRLERAYQFGRSAEIDEAERGFAHVRERAFARAFVRLRRQRAVDGLARSAQSCRPRARCHARRRRSHAARRSGGRGGGCEGGSSGGDPDPALGQADPRHRGRRE